MAERGVASEARLEAISQELETEAEHLREPGRLLTRLNRVLSGKFEIACVTAVFACIDVRARSLAYASAGHPPPLLRRAGGRVERLDESDLVLCVSADVEYRTTRMSLAPGDCVVFHTDGVIEAEAPGGGFLGSERLEALVDRAGGAEPGALVDSVLGEVRAWRGRDDDPADDITVVALRLDGDRAAL